MKTRSWSVKHYDMLTLSQCSLNNNDCEQKLITGWRHSSPGLTRWGFCRLLGLSLPQTTFLCIICPHFLSLRSSPVKTVMHQNKKSGICSVHFNMTGFWLTRFSILCKNAETSETRLGWQMCHPVWWYKFLVFSSFWPCLHFKMCLTSKHLLHIVIYTRDSKLSSW